MQDAGLPEETMSAVIIIIRRLSSILDWSWRREEWFPISNAVYV